MAAKDPRDEVPDLIVPPRRASNASLERVPNPAPAAPMRSNTGDFGMDLERSTSPASGASSRGGSNVSIEVPDELDMEIERGGAMAAIPASRPGPRASQPQLRPSAPSASGLDVAYRRMDAEAAETSGPSAVESILAKALPLVLFTAALGGLVKLVHRAGGRNIVKVMPHAFDASSTLQSGSVTGVALALAIALGFIGLKIQPRSYAMLGSAGALVITTLAMVTVTLVSTEEHPTPPDGALLVPYVVPFALFLLGAGVAARGPSLFLRGGAQRLYAALAAIAGGAIVFVAIEVSALASRLP